MRHALGRLSLLALCLTLLPSAASAQDAARYYDENCALCHTIGGGDMAGPDLKGSTDRRDRRWLVRFLLDPEGVVESGDDYAVKLVAKWDGNVMPATDGLTEHMAEELVEYIERRSRDAAEPPTDEASLVFTDEDRARGLAIFTGQLRLTGGGPSCLSCHGLGGAASAVGGLLGPDLAAVHTRLGGARGTTAWLAAPPTPMMRALYRKAPLTEDESRALAALFENAAAVPAMPVSTERRRLLIAGLAGAVIGLVVMGIVWSGRFRSVRRRLLSGSRGDAR